MKKIIILILISVLLVFNSSATAENNEKLLEETVLLSRKVKEFEKTLGIKPSAALSKTTLETPAKSIIWIWVQKSGTTALSRPFEALFLIEFPTAKNEIPIEFMRAYYTSDSYFFRQGEVFSGDDSVITVEFAKMSLYQKVSSIVHEDLHSNDFPGAQLEAPVTVLADIAAVKFLEMAGDVQNAARKKTEIDQRRTISKELLNLAKEAEKLFNSVNLPPYDKRKKAMELLAFYPNYNKMFEAQAGGRQPYNYMFEAKISHDLNYYGCYDSLMRRYDEIGDFKTFFEEIKKIPKMNLPESLAWCSSKK